MNILLIEDDPRISDFVIKGLEEHHYRITLATSGEAARELITASTWDLILMDIMLPGIDGVQLTKLIRFKKIYTPILAISALSELGDKVNALDGGADDYLTKPFHFQELLSRINALTRRSKYNFEQKDNTYRCGELSINMDEHTTTYRGESISLSPREFRLLLFLMENKNKVVPRTQILTSVWGINYDNNTNVVDVYISYLRNKIDGGQANGMIRTIKGVGYMLKEQDT